MIADRRHQIVATMLALALGGCGASGGHSSGDRAASSQVARRTTARAQPATGGQVSQRVPSRSGLSPAQLHNEINRAFAVGRSQSRQAPPITGEHGTQARFDTVITMLPIRQPPLPIQQYMTNRGSHRVVIRPTARDFYCLPLGRRAAVVAAYSMGATALFKAHRIDDVSFVVDALRTTGDIHPLARARGSSVSLTALGRQRHPC